MASFRLAEKSLPRLQLEIQQIDHLLEVYGELLAKVRQQAPDLVELTALASVLHSFYTGIEKIFTHIAKELDHQLPSGSRSHRDLLDQMGADTESRKAVLTEELIESLDEYLDFRHFYRHGYSSVLEWEKLEGLVTPMSDIWERLKLVIQTLSEALSECG